MTNLQLAHRLLAAFGAGEDRIRFVAKVPRWDVGRFTSSPCARTTKTAIA